jgi:hypothetical protein
MRERYVAANAAEVLGRASLEHGHDRGRGAVAEFEGSQRVPGAAARQGVAAQVEIESKVRRRFIIS